MGNGKDVSKDTFIIIPDTQKMSRHHPDEFINMTKWIVKYHQKNKLDAVIHLGDVVDNGAKVESEYQHASKALDIIYDADIPLLIVPGNHDYDIPIVSSVKTLEKGKERSLDMFNKYFGIDRVQHKPWFGELFQDNRIENSTAIIGDYLFILLEFGPRDDVLEWANQLIEQDPNKKVIVITHCYMYIDGNRTSEKTDATPRKYLATKDANDGEEIWQKLIKHHPNIIGVFSGHHLPTNVSHRVDMGIHGNQILQAFQNWQAEDFGGSGRLRIVQIDGNDDVLESFIFNPLTNQTEHELGYDLTISLKS